MPFSDPEKARQYHNEWRKKKRRERGLKKSGRKPHTSEQTLKAIEARKVWEKSWRKLYSENKPQKRLLWAAARRAKTRGVEFLITEQDIIIPEVCPYLGIKMKVSSPRGTSRGETMSLDRIDPTKGYIPGNIEVISHLANTMKNNATREQLIIFAKTVLLRAGLRDPDPQQRTSL